MPQNLRILVIEDDPDVSELLQLTLEAEEFEAITANDVTSGLRAAYQQHPDAIILDVMLPAVDGFEGCRRLREMTSVPILFLTGKATTTDDVVRGLALGADDYMTKPFSRAELISRLKAALRRSADTPAGEVTRLFPTPNVVLDCDRHELTIDDRTIYLCPLEFRVLEMLVRHAGRVLGHDAILAQVWGPERIGESFLVRQYIYQLRQKVEVDPTAPKYIHAVRGEGYYFEAGRPPQGEGPTFAGPQQAEATSE
jgi:DNA-binding response OmpR family regulator